MPEENNKIQYESVTAVSSYSQLQCLLPLELLLLNSIRHEFCELDFLDIGIGGGRSTLHIAPFVRSYTGIDYSENLIALCQERFINYTPNIRLFVQDARQMEKIESCTKDFAFFSYNGIDSIDLEGRILAIREIHRCLRDKGRFLFSSHHLNSIIYRPDIRKLRTPSVFMKELFSSCTHFAKNKKLKKLDYLIFNDAGLNGKLNTFYIMAEYQLKILAECGFRDIAVYALNGSLLKTELDFLLNKDPWLFYYCRK
ncbi:MAG: methyltransferase domain-containing protein [Bacteroidales bacterium]|jgi:SAM-dependent methyltransferase